MKTASSKLALTARLMLVATISAATSSAVTLANTAPSISSYQSLLIAYPLIVHTVQAGLTSGVAKLTAQKVSGGSRDLRKVRNAAAISALFVSPVMTFAYSTMLPWAKRHGGMAAFWACDQLVVPLFLNFTIMFFNFYLGAKVAADAAVLAVAKKLPKAMLSGWCFWVTGRLER